MSGTRWLSNFFSTIDRGRLELVQTKKLTYLHTN